MGCVVCGGVWCVVCVVSNVSVVSVVYWYWYWCCYWYWYCINKAIVSISLRTYLRNMCKEKKCLKIMTRTRTIHYCNVCDYKTDRKYYRDKHVYRMHGSNVQQNTSQAHENGFNITQESIQHTYPNEDYNVNNIQNQTQSGFGSVVTSVQEYNVNNLLNQTQSGFGSVVTSVGDNDPPPM